MPCRSRARRSTSRRSKGHSSERAPAPQPARGVCARTGRTSSAVVKHVPRRPCSEVTHPFIRALSVVPAHGRIRRRSSALFRTALTCGQTPMRACSSSLTTSRTYAGARTPVSATASATGAPPGCECVAVDSRPRRATSRTTCAPDDAPGRRWPPSFRAGEPSSCAHVRNASVRGSDARHTRQAACTSNDCRCGCALRMTRPRRCFSPELYSRGTRPRVAGDLIGVARIDWRRRAPRQTHSP